MGLFILRFNDVGRKMFVLELLYFYVVLWILILLDKSKYEVYELLNFLFSMYLIIKYIYKNCINLVEIFVVENIFYFIFII